MLTHFFNKNRLRSFIISVLTLLAVLWFTLPYIWQIITSLTPSVEISQTPPILPSRMDWSHYTAVLGDEDFRYFILNSFIVALSTTLLAFIFGSLASFATSQFRFKRKALILSIVLSVSMFPPIAIVSPLYLMIRYAELRDTYFALILPYASFALPFMVWTLHNFFRELPEELMDAARIDGCSSWQIYYRVVLPITRPAIFTTSLLVFIFAWNEFIFALTFTSTPSSQTIPVGIALFPGLHEVPWGDIAAASIVVTIPLIILVIILQKYIVAGLLSGSVKG
ncbi:MAG: ABC transporter permease subunit [Caldithrix sp.]|nr:ABC transporter permease subunit [Caldithrix sp.]